jgi:putative ABC transport system permease protein
MKTRKTPPRLFLRFFRWYCHPRLVDHIEGDLIEDYGEKLKTSGRRKADVHFIIDVIRLCRPRIIRPVRGYTNLNTTAMYKSYFKIAWRNLLKNKGYSSINIAGLAVGMTIALLIGLWIWDEVSFNSYFANRDRLAQVMLNQTHEGTIYTGSTIQMPLGDALRSGYSHDIEAVSLASWNSPFIISHGANKLTGKGMWVQPDFPSMFSLKMLSGNYKALNDPSTMLISSSLAKAIFGNGDPINKSLRIDNRFDLVVGGVYEDLPHNTTFHESQLLLPWDNKENWMNTQTDNWMNHCGNLFVQLRSGSSAQVVSEKIRAVPTPHIKQWKEEVMLHALTDLHLYNEFENGKVSGGRIQFVWLFGIVGVFVLLLACINFMNLSTARSEKRAKEVGIRKAIGSARGQIVKQFLSESIVVAFLSFAMSLILAQLSLPYFNALADKKIFVPWGEPVFWLAMIGFTLFTGLISGSYPAFFLSSFRPVKILKGFSAVGRLAVLPRKVLVVVQFTVSVTLIICTMIVFRQIQFAKERSAGYNRDGLITVGLHSPELRNNVQVIKNELLQKRLVESMALSSQSPAQFSNNNGIDWRGKDPGLVVFFRNVGVTPDYGKTVNWTIARGRDFSADLPGDSAAMIINQKAAGIMGFEDPVGEITEFGGKKFTIIGVANDMLTQSPYAPAEPAFFITDDWMSVIVMRLNDKKPVDDALAEIAEVFRKYNPETPFDYSFVNAEYGRKFSAEERIGSLAGLFAVLAIFISCLGLFGLASFVAEQRAKEIGIRKVLGATVASLWKMLSKDFVILTVIACAISIPLCIMFMNNWLMQYEYRTTLTWQVFAIAALGAVALTLITVSFQAIKAAVANPVKNLRSE